MDDVINISGHRLGTAEIEDAMVSSKQVEVLWSRITFSEKLYEFKKAQGLLLSNLYPCIYTADA